MRRAKSKETEESLAAKRKALSDPLSSSLS
jgi:hypothetical protein